MTVQAGRGQQTRETLAFEPALLRSLADFDGVCISLYLRGHQGGALSQTAAQRIRSFSQRAEEVLRERGVEETDRRALIDPLLALADDKDFSTGQHGGWAILRNANRLITMPIPIVDQDRLSVESRFLLTPLLRLMAPAFHFDVLCLSRKRARLLGIDANGFAPDDPASRTVDVDAFCS